MRSVIKVRSLPAATGILLAVFSGNIRLTQASCFNPAAVSGLNALRFNPAQLALPARPVFSYRILDFGFGFDNNSFTLSQYNRYSGAYLDARAKQDILSSIPHTGLSLRGFAEAAGMEFGWANFAASVRTAGSASCLVPEELFELALQGNALDRTYHAKDAIGFAQCYMRAGASVGTALGRHFALGVGAYYLYGLACLELKEAEALLHTTPEAVSACGLVAYRQASGGAGSAFDAGAAFWMNGWYLSLSGRDIGGRIIWTDGIEQGTYTFALAPGNAYDIRTKGLFTQSFDHGPGPGFVGQLPLKLNLSAARVFSRWLECGAGFQYRLLGHTALDNGWLGSAVVELSPVAWLPSALEFACGQPDGPCLAASFALALGRLTIATRFEYVGGPVMAARGARFAAGLTYAEFRAKTDSTPFRIAYSRH
ncbi:MAG: hypothetical protein ABIL25_04080 [candidate division WOR-3 bacterium]